MNQNWILSVLFQMRFWIRLILFIFIPSSVIMPQDYLWPTDASNMITSTFCEYRPDHFHAGIDIKTWGHEGYKALAIESGSIVQIRVSPYGYGRAVYLLLDNGITAIYAHLFCFSALIQQLVKEEQKKQNCFSLDISFNPGVIPIEKGELIGYTGRSGTKDPHLHFETRDTEHRPFNPLSLGYIIEDTIPPALSAVAVSPLSFGSYVDNDFRPKVFSLREERKGIYYLDGIVKIWGRIGISLSTFDQANNRINKFAVYRIQLFVDKKLVFNTQYKNFDYTKTRQINIDRDYRLKKWGFGLFHKLYRDVGNDLSFYDPVSAEAGVLCCYTKNVQRNNSKIFSQKYSKEERGIVFLETGNHSFRIKAMDYFGNFSEVRGVLRITPVLDIWTEAVTKNSIWKGDSLAEEIIPKINVDKHILEETIRFCVKSNCPLHEIPTLITSINSRKKTFVPLIPINSQEFIGAAPWDRKKDGAMTTEVRFKTKGTKKFLIRDTMEVVTITPKKGGKIISADGICSVIFPKDAVYRPILGSCQQDTFTSPKIIQYNIFPQDVPLKKRAKITIDISAYHDKKEELGIYCIDSNGNISFAGNRWGKETLFAWITNLDRFAVLRDTVPPEIIFVRPDSNVYIQDPTPKITVGFKDTLSGIYGEENYCIQLNGIQLIVEYDPENNVGFHQIEQPLNNGEHVIDIMIRDRTRNTTKHQSRFFIDQLIKGE